MVHHGPDGLDDHHGPWFIIHLILEKKHLSKMGSWCERKLSTEPNQNVERSPRPRRSAGSKKHRKNTEILHNLKPFCEDQYVSIFASAGFGKNPAFFLAHELLKGSAVGDCICSECTHLTYTLRARQEYKYTVYRNTEIRPAW